MSEENISLLIEASAWVGGLLIVCITLMKLPCCYCDDGDEEKDE